MSSRASFRHAQLPEDQEGSPGEIWQDAEPKADGWLNEMWRELRNGAGPERMAYFKGAVDVLADLHIVTRPEQDGWIARARQCPGHDDEGGRDWCAYCGDMPKVSDAAD